MQHKLNTAEKWCHDNELIINATKTKLMHIKPSRASHRTLNTKFITFIHIKTIIYFDQSYSILNLLSHWLVSRKNKLFTLMFIKSKEK